MIIFSLRLALLFVLCTEGCNTYGQQGYQISGKVLDSSGNTLPEGSVLLLGIADSAILHGALIKNGNLLVNGITRSEIILEISSAGYEKYYKNISNTSRQSNINLGNIRLLPKIYVQEAATVKTFRISRLTSIKEGNLLFNIENSALSSSISMEELLSKTPGIVYLEGGLAVVGKGAAIIYYNGEMIPFERLQSIPVSQIKSIEIVSNPSARFDAQGRAVILITGRKIASESVEYRISQAVAVNRYLNYGTDVSVNFSKRKLSFTVAMNAQSRNRRINLNTQYGLNDAGAGYHGLFDYQSIAQSLFIPTYVLGLGVELDKKNSISAELTGNDTRQNRNIGSNTLVNFNTPGNNYSSYTANKTAVNYASSNISVNFRRRLDTLGSNFFIGTQFFKQDYHSSSDITQDFISASNRKIYYGKGQNDVVIFSTRADLEFVTKKNRNLVIGAKTTLTSTTSDNPFFLLQASGLELQQALSNKVKYNERITAGYLQYGFQLYAWQLTAGLRAEATTSIGENRISGVKIQDTAYVNLFPSVAIERNFAKGKYGVSYAARLARPNYDDLDPYIEYVDSLTVIKGNPLLKPAYIHSFEAFLVLNDYLFKIGYSVSENEISPNIPVLSNGGAIVVQKYNLDNIKSLFALVTVPFKLGIWSSENTLNLSYVNLFDSRFVSSNSKATPLLYASSNNVIRIPRVFNIELSAEYSSRESNGFVTNYDYLWTEVGISRMFLNKKLLVRATANDPFNIYYTRTDNSYLNRVYYSERRVTLSSFRLSVSYRFGKAKNFRYSNKKAGEDELRRTR